MTCNTRSREISWLRGNGDGTLGAASNLPINMGPQRLASADFDRDGNRDLAVTTYDSDDVRVLLGNGDGTFGAPVRFSVGDGPREIASGDLNGDGIADLVAVNERARTVTPLLGRGDGTFQAMGEFGSGLRASDLSIADFDGDGSPDVGVAGDQTAEFSVLPGNGDGTLRADRPFLAGGFANGLTVADFDGNGSPDVALALGSRDAASILLGRQVSLLPPTLPAAMVRVPYLQTIAGARGAPPYQFQVTAGSLPPGLSLDAVTGDLAGTPTTAGLYPFEITATDATGCDGTRAYELLVSAPDAYVFGQGHGLSNPNQVRVYDSSGTPTTTDFLAYAAGQWGVNVASGLIQPGLDDSIVTGPGPGPPFGPQVRAFDRDGSPLGKVNFYAYGTLKYGVNTAAPDTDGDSLDELLSGAGPGGVFGPHVRGWNFDGVALTALARINFFAYQTLKYGVQTGSGDTDADGYAEILTGVGPGAVFSATVRGFDVDGGAVTPLSRINFNAFPTTFGVIPAGGDVDDDGYAEIATARGPGPSNDARLFGFDFDGGPIGALPGFDATPFPSFYGARVGLGDLSGDGSVELLSGAGPDPGADSTVLAFDYQASTLSPFPGGGFQPFTGVYGVNVAAGGLGF